MSNTTRTVNFTAIRFILLIALVLPLFVACGGGGSGSTGGLTANSGSITVDEDVTFSGTLDGDFSSGTSVEFFITSAASMGTVQITNAATGSFTYISNFNQSGSDLFRFKIRSGSSQSNEATVSITVNPVNDAPVVNSTPVTTASQGAAYSYDVVGVDAESDNIFYALDTISINKGMTINATTGLLEWIPGNAFVGFNQVTVIVSDDGTPSSSFDHIFTISVANVNDAPTFTSTATTNAVQNSAYNYSITSTDPDVSDDLVVTATVLPSWLSLTDSGVGNGNATLTGAPTNADIGNHDVTLVVTDTNSATDTQSFTITVTGVNDLPSFTSTPVTAATQDQAYSYSITSSDPDVGDTLTITATTLPAWLILTDSGVGDGTATLTGTPGNDDVGSNSVVLVVTDSANASVNQSFTINVTNVNDPPVLDPVGDKTVSEDHELAFNVSANDIDGIPVPVLGADLSGLPAGASFINNGDGTGSFSWTPTAGDAAGSPYSVTITATDAINGALNDSEVISIEVIAGDGAGPFEQDAGAQGIVSMEAENSHSNTPLGSHSWAVSVAHAGFTGTGTMEAVPEDLISRTTGYSANSPRLDFQVEFLNPGIHYVWVRGYAPSTSSDSLHVGMNGVETASADNFAGFTPTDTYVWSNGSVATLNIPSAGVHTINVWMRESGMIADKLVLTTDSGFTPSGNGPAESPRGNVLPLVDDFTDGAADGWTVIDETGDASSWSVVSGTYRQVNDVSGGALNLDGSYHLGTMSLLTSSMTLTDYRFSVDATSLDSGEDIGIVFRYQDSDNYYRLSLNSGRGFTLLEKKVAGVITTLARNSRGYQDNELLAISVEIKGNLFQVYQNNDPLFSVNDSDIAVGGIGLYSRDSAQFDNVTLEVNDTQPSIVISTPAAYSVTPNGPLTLDVTAIAMNVPSPGGSVDIELDGIGCGTVTESPAGVFSASCTNVTAGDHTVDAVLFDSGFELTRDTNIAVGVGAGASGGDNYVAIGDSITEGVGDNYSSDNISADGRTITFKGWAAGLGDLLAATEGFPGIVVNDGVSGDETFDALNDRLTGIIERNPDANKALLMLGTNDSNPFSPVPDGAGCSGVACDGTFNGNMTDIITTLQGAGITDVVVALLPPAFGDSVASTPYNNPLVGDRNINIQAYNDVTINELTAMPNVTLGPDFFSCFLSAGVNRFSLFRDNLHLNGLGQFMMQQLWHDALTGPPVVPGAACPAPVYILEDIAPNSYKQNLLEVGDAYYADETFVLAGIPAELTDGRWIMTDNADVANAAASLLSFDVGPDPVTVYVAYDSSATPPAWSGLSLSLTAPLKQITVSGAPVGSMDLYEATNVTGVVTLGGNMSDGPNGASVNYLVIVVKN